MLPLISWCTEGRGGEFLSWCCLGFASDGSAIAPAGIQRKLAFLRSLGWKGDRGQEQFTEKKEGIHHALLLVLVQCPALQGVARSQTRATHEWVQHLTNSFQTTDVSQCEITYEASRGKCLLKGQSGLLQRPEVSTTAVRESSSLCWYYLLTRNLRSCKRWKGGHHKELTT